MKRLSFNILVPVCILILTACTTQKQAQEPVYEIDLGEINVVAYPQFKGSKEKQFAIHHTKLELTPELKDRRVLGKATLTVSPYAYPQDTLELDAKNFEIHEIRTTYREGKMRPGSQHVSDTFITMAPEYTYDKQKLKIGLPKSFKPEDTLEVMIDYTARPEGQYEEGIIESIRDQGLYFIDPDMTDSTSPTQVWSQGETEANSAWFPTIEATNQKYSQEIYLTVDTAFKTLSNGTFVYSTLNGDGTRTDLWSQKLPHSPYLTMIAIGEWTVLEDSWRDSVEVNYYVEPEYAPWGRQVFGNTPEMIEFYSKLLQFDYPWDKYSQVVVREFVSGAMENTGAVTFFDLLNQDNRALLDQSYEMIIAHELFHHWFGDIATAESWAMITLNESLASYGEYLWNEHKYGKQEADYSFRRELELYLKETETAGIEPIVNYYYQSPHEMFDRHSYEKGALVMHMLRNEMGDEVFFKALNIYLRNRAFKNAELAHIRMAFEEASGKDLTRFFEQWWMRSGHPVLNVSYDYKPAEGKVYVNVEQLQQTELTSTKYKDIEGADVPVYELPVDITVYTDRGNVQKHVILGKDMQAKETFTIDIPSEPKLVNFDNKKILLADITEQKPLAQWYYQFFNTTGYVNKAVALQHLNDGIQSLSDDSAIRLINAALSEQQHYSIQQAGLVALIKGKIELWSQFETRVDALALNAVNSKVRREALFASFVINPTDRTTLTSSLQDSSYIVVAEAIRLLGKQMTNSNLNETLQLIKPYERLKSNDIRFAIAAIYAANARAEQANFFRNAIVWMNSGHRAGFMQPYAKWISKLDADVVEKEAEFLLKLQPQIKDNWSKVYYKILLNEAIKKLKEEKNSSIIEESTGNREAIIERLNAAANNLHVNEEK